MIYGYIRISSDKQTVENQRYEILEFCKKNGVTISGWIEETISGTKPYHKRALGKLLRKVNPKDIIICTELSRLGRNLFMIMEILSICMKKDCLIWTIKDHYRLGDTIESKVLAFAFGLSAIVLFLYCMNILEMSKTLAWIFQNKRAYKMEKVLPEFE